MSGRDYDEEDDMNDDNYVAETSYLPENIGPSPTELADPLFNNSITSIYGESSESIELRLKEYYQEKHRDEALKRHREFPAARNLPYRGVIQSDPQKSRRRTHCYACKTSLDTAIDRKCKICGWILCSCGACRCGYHRAPYLE